MIVLLLVLSALRRSFKSDQCGRVWVGITEGRRGPHMVWMRICVYSMVAVDYGEYNVGWPLLWLLLPCLVCFSSPLPNETS